MKKCYRFFGGFLNNQENWLNKMAHKGYRLVKTGKLSYEFEEAMPEEYQYAVEFVAHKSYDKGKDYKCFLEEIGYKVYYKNANLNYSMGKVKWRPYGKGMGQISTNPGSYNKELFIVEKKNDGKPFELHTTITDKADYYKPIRNAWLTITVLLLCLSFWKYIDVRVFSYETAIFMILGLLSMIPVMKYQKILSEFSLQAKIEE
jgi:hypothetical protein